MLLNWIRVQTVPEPTDISTIPFFTQKILKVLKILLGVGDLSGTTQRTNESHLEMLRQAEHLVKLCSVLAEPGMTKSTLVWLGFFQVLCGVRDETLPLYYIHEPSNKCIIY